ncbi:hypothetical protein D3C72_2208160 [compost metagenome]
MLVHDLHLRLNAHIAFSAAHDEGLSRLRGQRSAPTGCAHRHAVSPSRFGLHAVAAELPDEIGIAALAIEQGVIATEAVRGLVAAARLDG